MGNPYLLTIYPRYGKQDDFDTDQGRQFASVEFTRSLKDQGIQIGMDGKDCWGDKVFVERLWKSLTYLGGLVTHLRDHQRSTAGLGALPDVLQPDRVALCA